MSFKIKVPLFLFLSFVVVSIVFAFTFSGFDQPLKPYKKLDKSGIEQSYSWENSNPLGDSWGNYLCDNNGDGKKEEWCCCLYRGHLGEDWVLSAKTDVDNNDISKAEIGQSVYSIADGVIFKVANWPECPRDKSHGWGGVVLVKHQIPDDIDKKFNLTNTILPNPKGTEEAKKAEGKRIQGLEEKGTKVVYSMYGHLKNIQVKEGDAIKKGDKVGEIGEVCYKNSTKKYTPHLHFEIKDQNAIDGEKKIEGISGIGEGYSKLDAYAPNRYIPSNFIENNKNLIVEEKPIAQPQPQPQLSPPAGLTGGNDSLSFWDKIVFYWNGFVANVKEIFRGSTGEVQVAKPLTQTEVQQQTNNRSASSSAPRNDSNNNNNKTEENSSPPLEPFIVSYF